MLKLYALIGFLLFSVSSVAQSFEEEIKIWQDNQNAEMRNPEESPLDERQRGQFKGLSFFPINPDFRVTAQFIRTPDTGVFKMKTTGTRMPEYRKYATLKFEIKGKEYSLAVYQSQDLMKTEKYKDYLFVPFTDLSNGFETYGGGRYLDFNIPEGDTIILDFNKAYSPSCAYNHNYSCPIPPDENRLKLKVEAGVKSLVLD